MGTVDFQNANMVVATIIAKIQTGLNQVIGKQLLIDPDTMIELAKEIGFVKGVKGRDGGFVPTDEGLNWGGFDIKDYRAKEAESQAVHNETILEQRKRRKEQRSALFAQTLTSASHMLRMGK